MRTRSVTCAKNHDEPCDVTRKPNSRALCGLQQCPSSRRFLKPNRGTVFYGKKPPSSEHGPSKPIPPTTSSPRTLTTPAVPEPMSPSPLTVSSPSPTTASTGDLGGTRWQNSSTQTELDTSYASATGTPSQPILTAWSLSTQPDEEHVSNPDPGPTSEGELSATTMSGSDVSSSSNPVTWQVTPFSDTLSKEPDTEAHSGSGEGSEQPENKSENNSVIWTKTSAPGNDASVGRSPEMPLEPPPTPSVWGASLWPPVSAVTGLLPASLKNGAPSAEGMASDTPANTSLPPRGDHQPAPSEKPVTHAPPELLGHANLTLSSGPVLTEDDATSLIAEGFLLNASDYKQLSMDRGPAYWIVGNWSEVGAPSLTPGLFLSGKYVGVCILVHISKWACMK